MDNQNLSATELKEVSRVDDQTISIKVGLKGGKSIDTELSLKDAIILNDQINKVVNEMMTEVFEVIVPEKLKILIDCGRIKKLEYSKLEMNDDEGTILYSIRAFYKDESMKAKTFYHEVKFFEDETLLKKQLEYVNGTPIIFKDTVPKLSETCGALKGYNLDNLDNVGESPAAFNAEKTSPNVIGGGSNGKSV